MRVRKAGRIILTFSVVVVLTTCQLQFNKSSVNDVALQIVVPASSSGGGKDTPALGTNGKDLGGGTSLTVTITPPKGPAQTLSTSIGGKTTIDFSFSLSSSGSYQITAQMLDGSGNLLSTVTSQFAVPKGSYPIVLKMPSNLLSAALVDGTGYNFLVGIFSPTTYSYNIIPYTPPYTLTLTTVDPNARITSVTERGNPVLPSSRGVYNFTDPSSTIPVIIVVTAADGITKETYAVNMLL